MSKVSFRARALDATKPMPIYKACDIPDIKDFAQINRSVPQMPTGMEKEEETEHHLQRALSAQQVYGSSEALVIPIPEVSDVNDRYDALYPDTYKPSKQYIHITAFGMDQEIPDYDLDSEDETWLDDQSKKLDITSIKFEEMMDRLEKGSGQQVVSLQEAKLLLKDDDDLIIAVYDYWLNKRLKMKRPLNASVKCEKRDGTTTNNPYVAFRRRTEKMQTRKNRKNDEVSYEKMLKLRRDLQKTLTLLELLKRREKSKKELLQLTIEVLEKRNDMEDYSGTALAEAEEERDKHPTFVAPFALNSRGEWVQAIKGDEIAPVRKKRQYRKRKQQQQQQQNSQLAPPLASQSYQQQQHSSGEVDVMDSSDEDIMSPAMSQSDHEDENDPDGMFAFKRRKNCHYHQPLNTAQGGNWSWFGPEEGGRGDKRFRYSLTSLPTGCIGYARRRVGRGGRIVFDRATTPWDETLERLDFTSSDHKSNIYSEYKTYVRDNKIPHYRAKTPPPEEDRLSAPAGFNSSTQGFSGGPNFFGHGMPTEFDVESYHSHQEELLEQQREQQQKLLTEDGSVQPPKKTITLDLGPAVTASHQKGSKLTVDSAGAEFAVRALVDSPSLPTLPVLEGSTPTSFTPTPTASSPIGSKTNLQQLSFSLVNKPGEGLAVIASNGKTITNATIHQAAASLSSSSKLVSNTNAKLPSISNSLLTSSSPGSSISLLHKSPSVPLLQQNSLSGSSILSSIPMSSHTTILLSHAVKSNGPLSSNTHVKSSSGLSTSPAANVLQLNFPATSATLLPPLTSLSSSSPTVVAVTPATASTASSLQLQRSLNNKLAAPSPNNHYKIPVTAPSSNNFEMLRSNHEDSTVIRFNKDTGIPMDVT